MPTHLIKIHDYQTDRDFYLEWSTIVDAPITWGMSLEEFTLYYRQKYGTAGMRDFPNRMARTEERGCSMPFYHLDNTLDAILRTYDLNRPKVGDQREYILENFCRNHNTNIK